MIFSVPVLSFGSWAFNALMTLLVIMLVYWVVKFVISVLTGG